MKSIDQFIEILNEELILNEGILDLSIEKKDVIINNDTKRLNQMIIMEQDSIKKIIRLEKLRGAVVSNLEREQGIGKIDNIKDVVNKIDKEKARKVEDIASRLKEVLSKLESQNNLNNKLLKVSLEYLELNLNLLTYEQEPRTTYGKRAVEENSKKTSFFDAKY